MKKTMAAVLAIFFSAIVSASTPYLCFTDLTSGPSVGNSDNSIPGQIAGQDGAIVTVWGKNLGISQGSSQILVGGQNARVYSWGNAVAPADLYSKIELQMIEFQIPGSLSSGLIDIKVVVNGVSSNSLSFTIRSGNIFFIKTNGSDNTGDGSWTNPWATLDNLNYTGALDKIGAGDIVYICNGVHHTAFAGDHATIDLGNPGTESAPKAIIGYPGALASIGDTGIEKSYSLWVSGIGPTYNWVISKLHLTAKSDAASMYHNFRVVGNKITAPGGNAQSGAVPGQGNHLYLLGNELTDIGYLGTSKLYHPIYFQSAEACSGPRLPTETDREIAWNYIHDNFSYDGINIYRECTSSAFMTNHRVHNNYILNQTGCGIRIGDYVTGENWIYNNIVVNAGVGPDPPTEEAMHVPVYIHPGWEGTTTTIHFYNNTIYGGGFTGGAAWASSMVGFANTHPFTLDFRNNIIVSTISGVGYLNPSLSVPTGGVEKNIWYGAGASPAWDINPLNVDPLFVNPATNDFHLQDMSQAINTAVPSLATLAQPLPQFDFDANLRPQNNIADLGAFEHISFIVLPVSWLKVEAKIINRSQTEISWQVANEEHANRYIVQYSTDGIHYLNICTVTANSSMSYSCIVPIASTINKFFRVVLFDNNGQHSYSKTLMVRADQQPILFQVSPNPSGDYAILKYNVSSEKPITVILFSGNGASVQSETFTANSSGTKIISLHKIPGGFYSLRIHYNNEWHTIKGIKK